MALLVAWRPAPSAWSARQIAGRLTTASPAEPSAYEPVRLKAVIRARYSGGTCFWIAVDQSVVETVEPGWRPGRAGRR